MGDGEAEDGSGPPSVEKADSWSVGQRELGEEEKLIRVPFAPERSSVKVIKEKGEEKINRVENSGGEHLAPRTFC